MGRIFVGREASRGGENFPGRFLRQEIYQNSFAEFFLFVLLCLCRLKFTYGDVKENGPAKKFHRIETV